MTLLWSTSLQQPQSGPIVSQHTVKRHGMFFWHGNDLRDDEEAEQE